MATLLLSICFNRTVLLSPHRRLRHLSVRAERITSGTICPTPPRSRPYQPTTPTDADVADINAYEIINLTAIDEYVANLQPIPEDPDLEESSSDSEPTVLTDITLAPITLDARQLDYFMRNTRQ